MRQLIFITAHRRENLGKPMHNMFRAIRRVLDEHPERNDYFYVCALIEYIARETLNHRGDIVSAIGRKGVEKLLINALWCVPDRRKVLSMLVGVGK